MGRVAVPSQLPASQLYALRPSLWPIQPTWVDLTLISNVNIVIFWCQLLSGRYQLKSTSLSYRGQVTFHLTVKWRGSSLATGHVPTLPSPEANTNTNPNQTLAQPLNLTHGRVGPVARSSTRRLTEVIDFPQATRAGCSRARWSSCSVARRRWTWVAFSQIRVCVWESGKGLSRPGHALQSSLQFVT